MIEEDNAQVVVPYIEEKSQSVLRQSQHSFPTDYSSTHPSLMLLTIRRLLLTRPRACMSCPFHFMIIKCTQTERDPFSPRLMAFSSLLGILLQ